MRQAIENPVYMTSDEMKAMYQGKWIYIAKCIMEDGNELVGGVPIVVADEPFEGASDAFYDRFRSKEFAPRCHRNFNRKEQFLSPTFILPHGHETA